MLIVTAEKLVFGGDSLAQVEGNSHQGKVLFVPGLIPGEKAQVEIVSQHKDFDRAKIISILETSPHRVEAPCPYYLRCGGCNMLHIASDFQVDLRKQILQDIFNREGIQIPPIVAVTGEPLGYRCRMQLREGGLQQRGKSNSTIVIKSCVCGTAEINEWLAKTPPENRHKGKIQLFGDKRVVSTDGKNLLWASTEREKLQLRVVGKGNRKVQDRVKRRFSGTCVNPASTCKLTLSPPNFTSKDISFDVRGFFQSNLTVLEKAIALVMEYLKKITVSEGKTTLSHGLDIYSGAGTISVFLADYFNMITLVEHNRDALVFAEQNLLGKPHQSYGIQGEKWAKEFGSTLLKTSKPEFVFVDPPRSGMERAVGEFLAHSNIPYIAYLSCDPATQARDCKSLLASGYQITQIHLLDFYPNTAHLETLAFLEKKN